MQLVFEISATVFVAYICLVRPFLTERLTRRADGRLKPGFRLEFYRRSILFKVGSVAFVVALMLATGQPVGRLLRVSDTVPLWPQGFGFTVLVIGLQILILTELLNRFARLRHFLVIGNVQQILPRTRGERWWWVPTALAAGFGEELIYRSFLIYYLMSLHLAAPQALLVSSVLFGVSHLYQGALGVAGTGVAGYLLGGVYISYGVIPVMIVHTLVDLRVALLKAGRS